MRNKVKGAKMGKKSVKENKNMYYKYREKMGYTREQASEKMGFISASRIEKIDNEKSIAHPEEVLEMSKCYEAPEMCNLYCAHECPIGKETVPEIEIKDISKLTLEMIVSLNSLEKDKDRLMEIAVDGKITDEELEDFNAIRERLSEISKAIDSLELWTKKNVVE